MKLLVKILVFSIVFVGWSFLMFQAGRSRQMNSEEPERVQNITIEHFTKTRKLWTEPAHDENYDPSIWKEAEMELTASMPETHYQEYYKTPYTAEIAYGKVDDYLHQILNDPRTNKAPFISVKDLPHDFYQKASFIRIGIAEGQTTTVKLDGNFEIYMKLKRGEPNHLSMSIDSRWFVPYSQQQHTGQKTNIRTSSTGISGEPNVWYSHGIYFIDQPDHEREYFFVFVRALPTETTDMNTF